MLFPEIKLASRHDVEGMLEIEQESFPCPWSPEDLASCIPETGTIPLRTWTARLSGRIAGYVTASIERDGLHVINLAVRQTWRKQGLGALLLGIAEDWGARLGVRLSRLEVRASSAPAVALYTSSGYSVIGNADEYYPDGETATFMERSLADSAATAPVAAGVISRCRSIPKVGVVLGSGLSWLADSFPAGELLPFRELPGYGYQELAGHPGHMLFSGCGRFVFLMGRRHGYQGFSGEEIVLLPGVLSDLGVNTWLLTSSSGAVDPDLKVGDAVLFADHINCAGHIPETVYGRPGRNVYSRELIRRGLMVARRTGAPVREGLFACASGPSYETSSEIGFLRESGVSTVSMSTVPEALFLSSRGCDVAAISMVTNAATPGAKVTHEEVLSSQETVRLRQEQFLVEFLEEAAAL